MTRAEFVKIINRAFGFKGEIEQGFIDVKADDWFAKEVAVAFSNGYLKGFPDGSFRPHAVITRAEVAVIMARILKIEEDAAPTEKFSDASEIPSWAKGSIGALTKTGYLKGYPDGSFGASKRMTRSESLASVKVAGNDYAWRLEEFKKNEEKKLEEKKRAEEEKKKAEEEKKKLEEKKKEEERKKKSQSKVIERSGNSGSSGSSSSSDSSSDFDSSGKNDTAPAPQPPAPKPHVPVPPAVQEKELQSIDTDEASYEIAQNGGEIKVSIDYHPADAHASNKGVQWTLIRGKHLVKIKEQTEDSITLIALDNGSVELIAALKSDRSITTRPVSVTISGQTVDLHGASNQIVAEDKAISGLAVNKTYVLKQTLDDEVHYLSVGRNGTVIGAFTTLKEAKLYSATFRSIAGKISELNNAAMYEVTEIDRDLAPGASEENKLTLKNIDAIKELGEPLVEDLFSKLKESRDSLDNLKNLPDATDHQIEIDQLKADIQALAEVETNVKNHKKPSMRKSSN